MSLSRVVFSSQSDHWSTPAEVLAGLDAEFGFTFDPCPLLTKESGLLLHWSGRVFCNPPYSKIDKFIKKGLWHLANGDCELLVFLLPARTDTAWFHDYCLKAEQIRFIQGRLKFGNAANNAPFPSMIVIWREWSLPATSI